MKAIENSGENQTPIAPLQFESPIGQLLSQIMQMHPHLLPAAIDQQLEMLQSDRDAQKEETPPATQDLLLYRLLSKFWHHFIFPFLRIRIWLSNYAILYIEYMKSNPNFIEVS